ncbi:MAG TPA: hypothetical protein VFZ16_21705, partial [Hyphomicrobiaceae bacterium]|nr:hypothetical protein [Hyphomicrobiaceae bacterium]
MSDSIAIGADTAARLLVRLRLRRTLNQALGSWQILRRKPVSGEKRAATAGKAKLGWLLAGLVGLSMIFGAFNLSVQALTNMQRTLGTAEVTASVGKSTLRTKLRRALPNAPGSGLPAGVLQAVALTALILLIAVTCFALGAGDLARPDWDLEWLATLPVSLSTLLAVRLIERTFLGGGLAVLWPFLAVAAWYAGHDIAASAGLGLLAAFPLLAIVATARTLIDTGLRLSVGPGRLRNLQSIVGLAAALLLYLALSVGISPSSYILDWAPALPGWAFWLPPGLASRVVAGTEAASTGVAAVLLVMQSAAIAAVGLALLMRQLKNGVVSTGARESGRRPARARTAAEGAAAPERRLLSPIQARELTLLARDRNFLVQTLVLPVIVIGAQLWFNAGSEILSSGWTSASGLAAVAFFISAYALMFSALQTLNNEGNALWILYSVPQPLDTSLWQKALLWGTVCLVYPLAVFAIALSLGRPPLQVLGHAVVVLAGVPIFAVIATALGVFASDPLQQQVQRRLRPSYMYLYMLLAGLYAYTIIASTVWQVVGLMVLTALLGLALWQKARDHLPYLLDPSASPPARVSLSDGLVAAMMFFVVQGLV